jgi:hypothetical protein
LVHRVLGVADALGVLKLITPVEVRRVTVIISGRFPPSHIPISRALVSTDTATFGLVHRGDLAAVAATVPVGLVDRNGSVVTCTASFGLVHCLAAAASYGLAAMYIAAMVDAAPFGLAV